MWLICIKVQTLSFVVKIMDSIDYDSCKFYNCLAQLGTGNHQPKVNLPNLNLEVNIFI